MNTSADANAVLRSTDNKENFHRLTRLLMCGGVRLLREKFDSFHSPTDLPARLCDPTIIDKLNKAKLSQPERRILYPPTGTVVKSTNFDITLTFRLLRTICNLTEPLTGWDTLPNSTDHSLEAELVRIKYYRNHVYGHNRTMEITDTEFDNLWKEIREALLRIAESISKEKRGEWEKAIDEFRNSSLITEEQTYVDELNLWYKRDLDFKDAVEQLGNQLQQDNADIRDQLQQGNIDVTDQLQQLNRKLDYVTTLISIFVEGISQGRQPIASSHLSIVTTSPEAAPSANTRTVIVPIHEEQPQFGGAGGTSREHLEGDYQDPPAGSYIWRVILSPAYIGLQSLLQYLKVKLGVNVVSHREGSLLITVTCSSLPILEGLWEDYSSGNLSKVVEEKLVTPDVLEKLGLSNLKLKTTITEEEYNKCKEFFLRRDKITPSNKASSKPKSIDEIDDIREMLELMTSLKVSHTGCQTLDESRVRLKEEMARNTNRTMGNETFQVLSEASKTDARKRGILCKLYEEAAEFFKQLESDAIMKTLQESLGDFKTTLEENLKSIKPRDQYVVLVAGETSAGKSSIINLILGEDLLPHSILSTTSTICELKYGEKPGIAIHFKDGAGESREPTYQELSQPGATYKEGIERFLNLKDEREKGSPYKKIELFWPHPLFQEGVMIVDSPGVGENDAMNKFVLDYLPHAFCFIYVIKSSNAGGVQEDRLGLLLNYATKLKKKANMDLKLFTSCALFVCNMWDQIPAEHAEEVKKTQIRSLTKKLHDLDEQSQIVYLSCQRAQLAQTYGVITEDFDQLLSGISNLVVSSMQSSLQMYSRWLEDLLSEASHQVRVLLKSTTESRQETEKKMKRVMDRMVELEGSQDRIFDELSECQLQVIKEIIENLSSFFQSSDTSERFCRWSSAQVPPSGETWEETKSKVLKCISEKAQHFVQEWEDEGHHFAKAQVALVKYCTEKYDIMEEEIQKVENAVLCDEEEEKCPTQDLSRPSRSRRETPKESIDVATPVWLRQGLASVVVGAPFVGALVQKFKQSIQYKKKLQRYINDPFSYMEKRSKKCLKIISSEDRLLPFINGQLEDAVQFLVEMKAKISRLRERDKKLYQQLLTETRSKFEIQGFYQPISLQLESLKQNITVFNIKEIRKSDFSSGELKWNEEETSTVIGRGTFSTVYRGVLSQKGQLEIKVALKVYRNPLQSHNVWHFIDEERALRELRHPNIVKFFGTNLEQSSCGTKVMVILELCKCSLKDRIMSHPENAPARSQDAAIRKNVLLWAMQILDALCYVHDQKFVHRDLKLDNLLLTDDDRVKLSDVGVAKRERDISGTFCGTLLYLAPEVLDGGFYDSKADMYSLGIILWEMWYAMTAFQVDLVSQSQLQFLNDVRGGLRPSHIRGTHQPWGMWKFVMDACWDKEPQHRPTARQSWDALDKLQNQTDMGTNTSPLAHELPAAESSAPPLKPQPAPKPRVASKPKPAAKPKLAPKPNKPHRASVSFSAETEDANVHFE